MRIQVIVGGQAGSEGKGAVAGYLAAESQGPSCVRVAGPNAGHSVVNPLTGVKHALRTIPVGAVTNPDALLAIAAGSEIDIPVLLSEVQQLEADGLQIRHRLFIDPMATILTDEHRAVEADAGLVARIGSTGKGIGAARAARIMRTATLARDHEKLLGEYSSVAHVAPLVQARGRDIQIEGTQGYLLSLHHRFYPQVTSSGTTALDFLAMARLNPWVVPPENLEIWVTYRPYPIRVAGESGPLTGETSWDALGLEPELTTVTKKVRRVGIWDGVLAAEAAHANRGSLLGGWKSTGPKVDPVRYALTMADQIDPALAGTTDREKLLDSEPYQAFLHQFVRDLGGTPHIVTTSDRTYLRPRGDDDL